MSSERNPIVVLLADDNDEGRMLACDALTESRLPNAVHCADGEDSLDYLRSHGKYLSPAETPRPGIVSLNLNLPKMDGREALRGLRTILFCARTRFS